MKNISIKNKMSIIKKSIDYVDENRCLNCLNYVPNFSSLDEGQNEEWRQYYKKFLASGEISAMSPSKKMVEHIILALELIGLSAEEVDYYASPKNPNCMKIVESVEFEVGTDFTNSCIGGCVSVKDFLKCIEKMLLEKQE